MRIGTKSVLFGAHCFFLHPWFVAWGWWKLYGFPFDPRLWFAFFLHDIGYLGKPNMDGPEGERHVEIGAKLMSALFDKHRNHYDIYLDDGTRIGKWGKLCLFHSRYYAKANDAQPSKLCFADKLSFPLTPRWMYLPAVTMTGEINEYLRNAQKADSGHWKPTGYDKKLWHRQLCEYMTKWVEEHKDGTQDTWTDSKRHAQTDSGVWK
jgi:hypothetical protein